MGFFFTPCVYVTVCASVSVADFLVTRSMTFFLLRVFMQQSVRLSVRPIFLVTRSKTFFDSVCLCNSLSVCQCGRLSGDTLDDFL